MENYKLNNISLLLIIVFIFTSGVIKSESSTPKNKSIKNHENLSFPMLNDSYVDHLKPKYKYISEPSKTKDEVNFTGPVRVLSMDGRKGLNPEGLYSRIEIPKHTLNTQRGSVVLWYFALSNKQGNILSSNSKDIMGYNSNFALHPGLVKFFKGPEYKDAYQPPQKAIVGISKDPNRRWEQIAITWDRSYNKIRFYVNGVLKGREDPYHLGQYFEKCSEKIYAGTPNICIGEIKFYDRMLNESAVKAIYKQETPYTLTEEQKEGRTLEEQKDEGVPNVSQAEELLAEKGRLNFQPDKEWKLQTSLSLKKAAHLDSFYIQGSPDSPFPTEEGLLVNTPYIQPLYDSRQEKEDRSQMYLWTKRPYEGDHLYWEVEFKVLRRNGLSLFMSQVSGPQREDFMQDYPLRTTGRMNIVSWENVRSYGAEYYDEMDDGIQKTDLFKAIPMRWHKLQVLQRGNEFIYAIDGKIFRQQKVSRVLNFGHIAIRCMLNTKVKFRNFKVYNQPLYKTSSTLASEKSEEKEISLEPKYSYLSNTPASDQKVNLRGPYRILDYKGRKGMHLQSIYSRIQIPKHTINKNRGSLTFWFLPLDELRNKTNFNDERLKFLDIDDQNPYYNYFPFIYDHSKNHNPFKSSFALMWKTGHKGLFAKFYQGKLEQGFEAPQKGFVSSNHMKFERNQWYQVGLTWNKEKEDVNLFVNGVLVGQEDQFAENLHFAKSGDTLYTGNPALSMSNIKFYDQTLSSQQISKLYRKNQTQKNSALQKELKSTYTGTELNQFDWQKESAWQKKLSVSLTESGDLQNFDIAGDKDALDITGNGLKVKTSTSEIPYSKDPSGNVTMWTKKSFEGRNAYIELEYKPLKKEGNVNLYTHVAGKFREDFFDEHGYDYSDKKSDLEFNLDTMSYSKKMEIWEEYYANPTQANFNLIGYMFNFYRHMSDHRKDRETFLASFITGLIPSDRDLNNVINEFKVMKGKVELNKWHKVQFLKKDGKLTCAIDGKIVIDKCEVIQGEYSNKITNFGRLGLRFSQNTSMEIRNFNAYFTPPRFSEQ